MAKGIFAKLHWSVYSITCIALRLSKYVPALQHLQLALLARLIRLLRAAPKQYCTFSNYTDVPTTIKNDYLSVYCGAPLGEPLVAADWGPAV